MSDFHDALAILGLVDAPALPALELPPVQVVTPRGETLLVDGRSGQAEWAAKGSAIEAALRALEGLRDMPHMLEIVRRLESERTQWRLTEQGGS